MGTSATALLSVIEQPMTLTLNMSKAAMEPPDVEHGSCDRVPCGHPIRPPIAAQRVNALFSTLRNMLVSSPVADIAPPFEALQLMKLHCVTVMLL